jgi:RecA-family ATPase
MLLYGDPKIGKSYAALQLGVAVATGAPEWLGFPVRASGPVAYIQLDTPRSLWATRLEDLKRSGQRVEALHLADRDTLGTYSFDILQPDHYLKLRSAIEAISPAMVIIDTARQAHRADENESGEMQQAFNELAGVAQPAALILIAHAKKPGENGPSLMNDNRGSNAIVGAVDAIVRFTNKGMYYVARSIEPGQMRLERCENGFWEVDRNDLDDHTPQVEEIQGLRAKARRLSELSGKSEEACRSYLRRLKK